MLNLRSGCLAFAAIGLALFQLACSQSQVTETLSLVVTAADAAVSVLEAGGQIPAPVATQITNYLGEVTSGVQFASTELASADSAALKASKIAQEFATISAPNLPPGIGAAIGATVQAVASAVTNFLSTVNHAAVAANAVSVPYAESFAAKGKGLKAAKGKLAEIAAKNAAVKARLAALNKSSML